MRQVGGLCGAEPGAPRAATRRPRRPPAGSRKANTQQNNNKHTTTQTTKHDPNHKQRSSASSRSRRSSSCRPACRWPDWRSRARSSASTLRTGGCCGRCAWGGVLRGRGGARHGVIGAGGGGEGERRVLSQRCRQRSPAARRLPDREELGLSIWKTARARRGLVGSPGRERRAREATPPSAVPNALSFLFSKRKPPLSSPLLLSSSSHRNTNQKKRKGLPPLGGAHRPALRRPDVRPLRAPL